MPPVHSEESALLGKEKLDDIELRSVHLQLTSSRSFSESKSEVRVRTDTCDLLVVAQGDHTKPCIITYHDIGLNSSHFEPFFSHRDMKGLIKNFYVLHVNAPGQELGAPKLPEDFVYTMEELANQLNYVLGHFAVKTFIGFGVGAGANVLVRYAIANPLKVDALTVINCSSTQAGWIEWACQKMNSRILRSRGMTQGVVDYLMWHHFGRMPERSDISDEYRAHFCSGLNANNLSCFVESYARRSDLGIERDGATLRMPVLNITAAQSPHVSDTVTFNGRLNPTKSTWLKVSDCSLVLEEEPHKVAEAFRLFLQGEGYVPPVTPTEGVWWLGGGSAEAAKRRACRPSPVIRITENPIDEAAAC